MRAIHVTTLFLTVLTVDACVHSKVVDKNPGNSQAAAERPKVRDAGTDSATAHKPREVPVEAGHPKLSSSPTALMKENAVREIQEALEQKGFLQNHQTNVLDEETSAALRKFQDSEKMPRTGAPDRETVRRLGISPEKIFPSMRDGGVDSPKSF